ncbi:MAG TPA: hypothetical protein VK152_04225 [Paludibacter sp.]|nr:hypothetical protein [Paludibacter sp.]
MIDEEDLLEIVSYYRCKLKQTDINLIKDTSISKILSILKEYKEIPTKDFILSFRNVVSYYPSEIPNHRYGFVEDVKDIKIEFFNERKTINYEYIRGRLSSKIETISIVRKLR